MWNSRIALAVCCMMSPLPAANCLAAGADIDYAETIEPILRQHCYECHDGGDETAGLRLDVRSSAMRGGESGEVAIVPGHSDQSILVQRIRSDDESERMPPEGPSLTESQIEQIRQWIDQGAGWPDELAGDESDPASHWAFRSPVRPRLPTVRHNEWARNDIDTFVLARLETASLSPSPEADRVTLIRRLFLDLIGLPPSIQEVDAFLLDNQSDAYQRLVEQLLKSPHYGERWGRIWLDAARYADSDGYEKDKSRQVWFYRDWVVSAFNNDMPYDRFIVEQLAGDLLPDATQSQKVATGFLRNSMINEEGGIHPEQFRMLAMFDRMDAIGKGVLGLTIQCSQCHNHKYDPLSQSDYYRLFAFLNNDHEANIPAYTPDEQMRLATMFQQITTIEDELQHRQSDWREQMALWEASLGDNQPDWEIVRPEVDEHSTGGQKYLPQADGSLLAQGYAPTKHTVILTASAKTTNITGFRIELMTDPNLPCNGPGRAVDGMGALTEFSVQVAPADKTASPKDVKLSSATADINPPKRPLDATFDDRSETERVTGPVQFATDGDKLTAWGIDAGPGRRNQPRKAVFCPDHPISLAEGDRLVIRLNQSHGGWNSDDNQNHNLGRIRLAVTSADNPVADPVPASVREILEVPPHERTAGQRQQVFRYWRTTVPDWRDANKQIDALWKEHPEGSTQLVLQLRDQMRQTHLLQRGDFLQPAEEVQPGVPEFLHALPAGAPPTRLTFARWLVDPKSPTVARSIVNRVWQAYFGLGLVETAEDLGTRGARPTHPQLLDWLAVELMDRGWSLKELHRVIVNSATYRQSSRQTEEHRRRDPYNRLLSRAARFRVDAEVVRDVALSVSGLLNLKMSGPSVHPPLPDFLVNPPVSYGPKPWDVDKGPDRYRRAVYTFRFRSVPYPALEVFDAPNGDVACVRRSRSNTPLQALTLWGEDVFVECARALATRMIQEGGEAVEDRARFGFRLCVSRQPSDSELTELTTLFRQQIEYLSAKINHESNEQGVSDGADHVHPLPGGVSPAEKAAWTTVARVLLNLDETISRE